MWLLEKINGNGYEVILSLCLANMTAQVIKTTLYAVKRKKFNISLLVSTGGMPSSHSSTVTGMATAVGLVEGWASVSFAIAICVATVVMTDAAGVRQAAGRQAWVLNRMIREILSNEHTLQKERLKEFLGHTPTEVLAGGVLGIAVAFSLRYLITILV